MKEQFAAFHVGRAGIEPLQGVHVGQDFERRSRSGNVVKQTAYFKVVLCRSELERSNVRGILFESGPVVGCWKCLKVLWKDEWGNGAWNKAIPRSQGGLLAEISV